MDHGFLVVRPKNSEMAKEAARIALELAGDQEIMLQYSIARALFSGVRSSELDQEGIKRYLKGACCAHNKTMPLDKNGIRDVFCSYWVGWACQAGESIDIIKRVNAELPDEAQITFPDFSEFPREKQGALLEQWAINTAAEHYDILKQYIKLDFDPKWTTPQRLYGFILEHPELFTQEMLIVPPQEEMEMQELPERTDEDRAA